MMATEASGQNIAIVGSGISGLTAAYLLHKRNRVTLFEANDYIGGHTHTIDVTTEQGDFAVDTGFIVCNDRNYPNFLKFMRTLDVPLQPSEMSFSVKNSSIGLEYNGHNLNTLFSQRRNLLNPQFLRFVKSILDFNKAAKLAISDQDNSLTLNQFLDRHHFSDYFRNNYLLPMVAAIWSCSLRQAGEFPLRFFLRFFLNHGLLDVRNRPQWYVLKGGSRSYIEPMTQGFRDAIHLSCAVQNIERHADGVKVRTLTGESDFDQVIMACHSDQALALLANPSPEEVSILGKLEYQDNSVILHRDDSIMPKSKLAWASWNFLAGDAQTDTAPVVTYCMNILQQLNSNSPFLVTLNAPERIADDKVFGRYRYAHPVYSQASQDAQSRRREICGKDRVHYCGAYWYSGFHEDGVRSALDVALRFGESL